VSEKQHRTQATGRITEATAQPSILTPTDYDAGDSVAKHSKPSPITQAVRTRRAYFDCRFGQLHVRTAFPTTGGFDEQATLFCLHSTEGSSRTFARFLPEIADERSVYAPDLPGCGESDPPPTPGAADAAAAISDFASDLRLRQIDVLGVRFGAEVALALAAVRPELIRRLVLIAIPAVDQSPIKHPSLVLRHKLEQPDLPTKSVLLNAQFADTAGNPEDLFDAAPQQLAQQICGFLRGK
jgi:pimeloyl-ACP methyl ester carboxylesterase